MLVLFNNKPRIPLESQPVRIFSIVFAFLFLTLSTPTLYAQKAGSAVAPDPTVTKVVDAVVKVEQKTTPQTPLTSEQLKLEREFWKDEFGKLENKILDREFIKLEWWFSIIMIALTVILIYLGAGAIWVTFYVTKQTKAVDEDKKESAQSAKDAASSAAFAEGNAYYNEQKFAEAIVAYTRAIELNPYYADAYSNRGTAKDNLGQYKEAIADYDEAIRLQPDYAIAYSNRGYSKDRLGFHEEALKDIDEAIRLNPDYTDAYNNRGAVKDNLEQYEDAIKDFDTAIRLTPDYALAYANRVIAYLSLGKIKLAQENFSIMIVFLKKNGKQYIVKEVEEIWKSLDDDGGNAKEIRMRLEELAKRYPDAL